MSENASLVSIIMPTLNSEKTIKLALESVRNQNFDQNRIEILVIDGGSTDSTVSTAEKFGAKILPNTKVQQEYAKHQGILQAKGKYAVFLDSDEILESEYAISNRVKAFEKYPDVKMVLFGGYKNPGKSGVNDYINYFSDPFNFFMTGVSTENTVIHQSWKTRYGNFNETEEGILFNFREKDQLPIVDLCAGNTIDLEYIKQTFPELVKNPSIVPQAFYLLVQKTGKVFMLKNDQIIHYSADTIKKYINKLKWRVVANIHHKKIPGTGFSNRENFYPISYKIKKFLFIPYSLTVVFPLIDAVKMFMKYKKYVFYLHPLLSFYVGFQIVLNYFLKILGKSPELKVYGDVNGKSTTSN